LPKKLKHKKESTAFPSDLSDMGKPTRKVITRSPHRSVGVIACSWIQNDCIEYESQLERRFLQRALLFPSLKKIFHQPFTIPYVDQGKNLTYTPDFLLVFQDGSVVVVEVKPAVFVKKHELKLKAAEIFLASKNRPFLTITDDEIDSEFYAKNSALLLRYARSTIADDVRARCICFLHNQTGTTSISDLIEGTAASLGDIYHLIGRGLLSIRIDIEITHDTIISIPNEEKNNGFIRFCNWFNTTPRLTNTGI